MYPSQLHLKVTQARGYLPEIQQQISDMALNGSAEVCLKKILQAHFLGIQDSAPVLKISPTTVIAASKKDRDLE